MSFDLTTWKEQAAARLQGIGAWLEQSRVHDAPYLLYGALCGASLWPLVEAAQAGQFLPVMMALGSVAGGVGGNLLAEQVQRWKDRAGVSTDEAEVAAWAAQQAAADENVRRALDAILDELRAIPEAQAALAEGERDRFAQALRAELAQLGSLARFEATLVGSGAVAKGDGAKAAHERSVAAEAIQAPVVTGDNSRAVQAGMYIERQEIHADPVRGREEAALARYLHNLRLLCNALPLAALAEEEGAHRRAEVTLNRVYISLNTTAQVPLTGEEKARMERERGWSREESRAVTALEAAGKEARLVILGDPGSGKSTFVNHLAYLLAGARLGEGEAPAGWPHGALLPVRVVLRELVARLPGGQELASQSADKRASRLVGAVWDYVRQELDTTYRAAEALPALEREIDACRGLVIFDGLDEVALEWRAVVRETVEAFGRLCGENRVLVTCRVRSYQEGSPLRGLADVTLAPFETNQIAEFVRRWYGSLADLGALKPQEAERRAADLRAAVRPLAELARNPLLLTTMAVVHTAQVELPRERALLYARCVDVLVRRWQRHKVGEAPLLAQLGVSESELLAALREVACHAHEQAGAGSEGDLAHGDVLRLLARPLGGYGRAEQFLEYVDTRAGLLVSRGGAGEAVYSFPHRTFQEYLAGCHLAVGGRDFSRRLLGLLGEGERWALAARLGAEHLLYNVGDVHKVLDAAYTLCPVSEPEGETGWRGVLWAGQFAAEVGRRRVEGDRERPDGGPAFLERLIPRLVRVLREGPLGAVERAAAGRALGRLGDPRPEVTTVEGMDFCYVPPGPFVMGSQDDDMAFDDEKPQHTRDIRYGYWLGRYPVTNAQYAAFVAAGGYGERRYWTEAGWGRKEAEGWTGPGQFGDPYDLPNHPAVGVSWYEAVAFCRWLTEEMRARAGEMMTGLEVRLPSEAEWEKAARGGRQVPKEAVVGPAVRRADVPLAKNLDPARRYPWGAEPEPEQANYGDTRVGTTSAVGSFPGGVTPYGAEEMSGNVWEWCATCWQGSYEGYRDDNAPEGNARRVVRGGAFHFDQWYVRCAYRYFGYPGDRGDYCGFRCMVAPAPSGI